MKRLPFAEWSLLRDASNSPFHWSSDVIDWREHITADSAILVGKPTVRGTRLSVEHILTLFAEGWSVDEVLRNYPTLKREALPAVFAYAADAVRSSPPLHASVTE